MKVHAKVSIEVFPDRTDRLLNSPTGPVGVMIQHVANVVLVGARARIGDRYSGHHPGPRIRDTGSVVPTGGASFAVVFNHDKAFLHHNGAVPHSFGPSDPALGMGRNGPGVVTSWNASRFWTKQSVNHPGSPANPFIADAAEDAGLRPSGTLLRGDRPTRLFRLRSS